MHGSLASAVRRVLIPACSLTVRDVEVPLSSSSLGAVFVGDQHVKGASNMSKNDTISFDLSDEQQAAIDAAATNQVQLSEQDIGQKREGEFIAWNCPFVECKTALA